MLTCLPVCVTGATLFCMVHSERRKTAFLVAWLVCSSFFAVVAFLRLIFSDLHLSRQCWFVPPRCFRKGLLRDCCHLLKVQSLARSQQPCRWEIVVSNEFKVPKKQCVLSGHTDAVSTRARKSSTVVDLPSEVGSLVNLLQLASSSQTDADLKL